MPPKAEAPVKLACATCIQGHRASSCKHQDGSKGPLMVIKRRGRPLSQCETCRANRSRTGRHTRCVCVARPQAAASKTAVQSKAADPAAVPSSAPLRFADLLNPCQCKTTGICTCCNTNTYDTCASDARNDCSASCCGPKETRAPAAACCGPAGKRAPERASCCARPAGNPPKRPKTDSMDLLAQAADMSRAYIPTCQCGPACQCAGCLAAPSQEPTSPSDVQPDCGSCTACDTQLAGPTGIGPVDDWLAAGHIGK